jgi:hypothetical protein
LVIISLFFFLHAYGVYSIHALNATLNRQIGSPLAMETPSKNHG